MKITTLVIAFSLAFLAACDRGRTPQTPQTATSGSSATPQTLGSGTPPTSANDGKDESNPVQGQVDPKQGEQHKDFQQQSGK